MLLLRVPTEDFAESRPLCSKIWRGEPEERTARVADMHAICFQVHGVPRIDRIMAVALENITKVSVEKFVDIELHAFWRHDFGQ